MTTTQENYMKKALDLAVKGCGHVNPNPLVGAVIVKDGKIIGEGYHEKYGGLHAERAALLSCSESAEGAEMYVTLEPCCHYGKQPPCTDAIIASGIKHVYFGSVDPNPSVNGRGSRILKKAGIQVTEGFMKKECDEINEVFFHYITKSLPYVILKYAMTYDGKIATKSDKSKWITGEAARAKVHSDRNRYSAILVGIGTVLKDDPLLTCRIPNGRSPVRIICDTDLSVPMTSQIVRTAKEYRTIIASDTSRLISYSQDTAWMNKAEDLKKAGCEIIHIPSMEGMLDMKLLMKKLAALEIDSVIIEGGGGINWSALKSGIVNKVQVYVAPKIFGGAGAPSPVMGEGIDSPNEAYEFSAPKLTVLGDDILMESEVKNVHRNS